LNSWAYPGAINQDEGPGSTIDAPGLIELIYRTIATGNRADVWITDDGINTEKECEYISFSHFKKENRIYLYNIDFKQSHTFYLHSLGDKEEIILTPGEFRILNLT
jgi:hypothetical protein